MKLSTKGRYAVMAMVDLARHSSGRPVSLAEIAERQEISLSYLEQLFAKLRRGGLVNSVRGPGGGYLLARGGGGDAHLRHHPRRRRADPGHRDVRPAPEPAAAATRAAASPTICGRSSATRSISI